MRKSPYPSFIKGGLAHPDLLRQLNYDSFVLDFSLCGFK